MKIISHKSIILISALFFFLAYSCQEDPQSPIPEFGPIPICQIIEGSECISYTKQRFGDPERGKEYLFNGNYIKSGIPYDIFTQFFGEDDENLLERSGDNANINYEYTAVDAPNGVRVVAPNCLQCHAQKIDGQFVMGLGNVSSDFTVDQSANADNLEFGIIFLHGENSPEHNASKSFLRAISAIGPHIITEVRGANPADKLAAVLAAHRNPDNLNWVNDPQFDIPQEVIPSDVPPWWHMKKKNAMFYSGLGRKDFARFMMASSLLTVTDTSEAKEIDAVFNDVRAYINSLNAPGYTGDIDEVHRLQGRSLFKDNCAKCHGNYGDEESYPNALIPAVYVGTDPILAQSNFSYPEFIDWFNSSWFSSEPNAALLVPSASYLAPPLDGIWATAPYLHNGSIPTLYDLLNSPNRPTYWKRSFNTSDYDHEKMGWLYTVESNGAGTDVYDTTIPGYGNMGHNFGDFLNEDERWDLIEYLKSL